MSRLLDKQGVAIHRCDFAVSGNIVGADGTWRDQQQPDKQSRQIHFDLDHPRGWVLHLDVERKPDKWVFLSLSGSYHAPQPDEQHAKCEHHSMQLLDGALEECVTSEVFCVLILLRW
jgi:hypothetical protein